MALALPLDVDPCAALTVVTMTNSSGVDRRGGSKLRESSDAGGYRLIELPWVQGHSFLQKVTALREVAMGALRASCNDSVLLLTDAFDSFLSCTPARLMQTFTRLRVGVLFSVELDYSWQLKEDRPYYEALAANASGRGFLNSGGIMGYAGQLLPLLDAAAQYVCTSRSCRGWFKGADQAAFSHVLASEPGRFNASLDYANRVFLVPRVGWKVNNETAARFIDRLRTCGSCVVHVPWIRWAPSMRALTYICMCICMCICREPHRLASSRLLAERHLMCAP